MKLARGWETGVAGACALAAFWLPVDCFKDVTSELVTLLGIVAAALIPTMLLAATTLRAGRFSSARLLALSAALDRQIGVFGGLFIYALLASLLLIVGKMAGWQWTIVNRGTLSVPIAVTVGTMLTPLIVGLLAFLGLRGLTLIAGIRSLLSLSASMAIDEAAEREEVQTHREMAEINAYAIPERYGEAVDLSPR